MSRALAYGQGLPTAGLVNFQVCSWTPLTHDDMNCLLHINLVNNMLLTSNQKSIQARPMRVGTAQLPHVVGDPSRTFGHVLHTCELADSQGIQLLCLPECYLQGYDLARSHVSEFALGLDSVEFQDYLRRFSILKVIVVLGLIEKTTGGFYNTAVVIHSGKILGVYRKQNLLKSEMKILNHGLSETIFELDGYKIGICICNDMNNQALIDKYAEQGVKLLVCPSNNYMGRRSAEKWKNQHTLIRAERARNAGLWLLSSDVTGHDKDNISYGPSSLINPHGIVVADVPLFKSGICMYDIMQG